MQLAQPLVAVPVAALHLLHVVEPHRLVDFHIRHILAALEIAAAAFVIGESSYFAEEGAADSFTLGVREHGDNVNEVIAVGVGPEGFLGGGLSGFPDVVALRRKGIISGGFEEEIKGDK